MRISYSNVVLLLLLCGMSFGQGPYGEGKNLNPARAPLGVKVHRFDVADAILRDGLSELRSKNIEGLHLGFEEIIRSNIHDNPKGLSSHFSLHLEDKTVGEIINLLCKSDSRYTWSEYAASINIYPRITSEDPGYLLNLRIDRLVVDGIPDPDQGLTPLSKLFPGQQVGYFGPGLGDNTYAKPWTATFEHLTVRQFVDRIAEHMGPRTSWIWQGGKDERMFTFVKGSFRTQ